MGKGQTCVSWEQSGVQEVRESGHSEPLFYTKQQQERLGVSCSVHAQCQAEIIQSLDTLFSYLSTQHSLESAVEGPRDTPPAHCDTKLMNNELQSPG